jgi:hypothetical protein
MALATGIAMEYKKIPKVDVPEVFTTDLQLRQSKLVKCGHMQ